MSNIFTIYVVKVDNYVVTLAEEGEQSARITAAHSLGKPVRLAKVIEVGNTTNMPFYKAEKVS